MSFQPQLFKNTRPPLASEANSFYNYFDAGSAGAKTTSDSKVAAGPPHVSRYVNVPDELGNDEDEDEVIDMTDANDEDLLAMTEEEKQQFATQLDQWETIRRVHSQESRPKEASRSPSAYQSKLFSASADADAATSRAPSTRDSMAKFNDLMSGYQYATQGRRPSTLGTAAADDTFYKKTAQWSQKIEAAMDKQRGERESAILADCTFAPSINPRVAAPERKVNASRANSNSHARDEDSELSERRRHAAAAFGQFINNERAFSTAGPQPSAIAAAAASRLYEEHSKRHVNNEARLAAAAEERAQHCTFTPRVCRKQWAQHIAPRYLDAYADRLEGKEEGGEVNDRDASELGRASRGGASFHRTASTVRSVGRASSARGGSHPPLDDNCTFKPVTNSLNRLQQQYKGPNSIYGHGDVPLPPVPSSFGNHTNTSLPNESIEPTINMEALTNYLSLPAHERLALDAKRKHQTHLESQQLVDKIINEQSRPVINARSASVVALSQNQAYLKQTGKTSVAHNVSISQPSQNLSSFLNRLESSNAKREAKHALLKKTVEAVETPFTPRTNVKFSKLVKSHFEQDAEALKHNDGKENSQPTEAIHWAKGKPGKVSGTSRPTTFTPNRRAVTPNISWRAAMEAEGTIVAPDPECTFKPSINATKATSKYAQIDAALARKEARLEKLREELTLEREQKELGMDLGEAAGSSAGKGMPASADLTPRRPFSPSISKRTASMASDSRGKGISLAVVTKPSAEPEAYRAYVAATERRKLALIKEQQAEQKLLEDAQLTFKPTVHEVPEYIKAMGQALRARGEAGGRQPGAALPVHRAKVSSANSSFMAGYEAAPSGGFNHREQPAASLGMRFT